MTSDADLSQVAFGTSDYLDGLCAQSLKLIPLKPFVTYNVIYTI